MAYQKFEGKLNSLAKAFEIANPESDIESVISYLKCHNWNLKYADFTMKMLVSAPLFTADDMEYFESLVAKTTEAKIEPEVSENEKLDRVLELSKNEGFDCDYDEIKPVVEALKLQEPS